jgi:hypothetical protein
MSNYDQVEAALANSPEANGYGTDLWTLARVADVIERITGVAYHPHHVWRILREQLGWSWQRPARRAVERNDEAIHQWVKHRWPTVKRARRQHALIVFEDESGISLLPSVRATWAPKGRTLSCGIGSPGSGCRSQARWCTNPMAVTPTSCSTCVLAPTPTKRSLTS